MAYFADEASRDKLTVLFFLDALRTELTRAQLTTVSGEKELIPYFELQSAVYELEEEGFVAAVPRSFGQAYSVTPKGREALDLFRDSLPESLRAELSGYALVCRDKLRREIQFPASSERLADAGYRVVMRICEKDSDLLRLELVLPDAACAASACEKWPDRAEGVYRQLFSLLL